MFEIDVDVGRLFPFGRDETLEQQVVLGGIDLGDAQTEADCGIGRRAAPLAENPAPARKAHDVVHGEEIGRVAHLCDEREFMADRGGNSVGHACGIAECRARPGKGFERLLLAGKPLAQFIGIFIGQLIEREGEAAQECQRLLDGLGRLPKNALHFARGFQMPFGIGGKPRAGIVDGDALAHAGEHIGERAARGLVHVDIIGGDERQPVFGRQRMARHQRAAHGAAIGHGGGDPDAAGRDGFHRVDPCGQGGFVDVLRVEDDELQPFGMFREIVEEERALAFRGAQIAARQQPRQPPVGGAVSRIGENIGRCVSEDEPRAGRDMQLMHDIGIVAGIDMRPHDAGQRIAVGDADAFQAERRRLRDHFFRVRGPAQEGEIRGDGEFGVGHVTSASSLRRAEGDAAIHLGWVQGARPSPALAGEGGWRSQTGEGACVC